jgi:rubrerythrin
VKPPAQPVSHPSQPTEYIAGAFANFPVVASGVAGAAAEEGADHSVGANHREGAVGSEEAAARTTNGKAAVGAQRRARPSHLGRRTTSPTARGLPTGARGIIRDRMAPNPRDALIALLRLAYSGELAAAHAYRGHWGSLSDIHDREAIRAIEEDEWHHRRLVGEMLRSLGSAPARLREARAFLIGHALGVLCHVSGWLAPMYGAGKLERRNIREYEVAAHHAEECGRSDLVDCLLTMAEVEWEHEAFFRRKVLSHRWSARLRLWPQPPPKESIRAAFRAPATIESQPLTVTARSGSIP